MCGRFTLTTPNELKKRFATANALPKEVKPNYNVAPTQHMPVIICKDGKNHIQVMHWGLIPVWAADKPRFAFSTFNARAESLLEKPMWKKLFATKRCLVPATGFYEWKKQADGKQPFYIGVKDREIFAMAGLYDEWAHKDTGEIFASFTIITTTPNVSMKAIHDRMPVILDLKEENIWLDETEAPESLQLMLDPYTDKKIEMHMVTRDVGSVKNNNPELIYPIVNEE